MKWLMTTAIAASSNSKCKRKKVGAIIAKENRILSSGWNGMPAGMDNCCEKQSTIEFGGEISETRSEVIHAEANAILWAAKEGIALKGTTLYVTVSPCPECAKMIVQAGITKVVYKEKYRCTKGLDILMLAKVEIDHD